MCALSVVRVVARSDHSGTTPLDARSPSGCRVGGSRRGRNDKNSGCDRSATATSPSGVPHRRSTAGARDSLAAPQPPPPANQPADAGRLRSSLDASRSTGASHSIGCPPAHEQRHHEQRKPDDRAEHEPDHRRASRARRGRRRAASAGSANQSGAPASKARTSPCITVHDHAGRCSTRARTTRRSGSCREAASRARAASTASRRAPSRSRTSCR